MKKLCTVLLAVLMLLSVVLGVVACDGGETYTAEQMEAAMKLMDMRYGESGQPVKTESDYTVTNKLRAGAIIFNIKWEVENGGSVVTLGEPDEDGIITVKVGETKTEISYSLKATFVDEKGNAIEDENGKTYSKSFPHVVPVSTQKKATLEKYNESIIKNPEANKAYKWALFYQPDGKVYYFTGKNDGGDYKWKTSIKVDEAADVYVEIVDGGYHLYFMDGTTKKYIEPCAQSNGGASIRTAETPEYVIKMNENQVLYAQVTEDLAVYMGGYNTYNTIRGSSMEYLETAPDKQFPARLVNAVDYQYEEFVKPTTEAEIIAAAKNLADGEILGGTEYTFTLTGKVTSVGTYNSQYGNFDFVILVADTEFTVFRFKASSNTVVAVDQIVTVTGNITRYGEKLEITNGKLESGSDTPSPSGDPVHAGTEADPYTIADAIIVASKLASGTCGETEVYVKGYLTEIKGYNETYKSYNGKLADAADATGTFELYSGKLADGITEIKVGDLLVIKGRLKNFNGTYEIAYDSTHKVSPTVVSVNGQGGSTTDPEPSNKLEDVLNKAVTAVEADKAFNIVMYRKTDDTVYYFNGQINGKFLQTTTTASEAAAVYAEVTADGFYLYIKNGETKQYITVTASLNSKGNPSGAISLTDTATTLFTIDATHKYFVTVEMNIDGYTENPCKFVLGTYGSYTTISASSSYYIDGDNESAIDDSQFLARIIPAV